MVGGNGAQSASASAAANWQAMSQKPSRSQWMPFISATTMNTRDQPMTKRNEVPCNGCTACCKRERVLLAPEHGDRIDDYDVTPTRPGDGNVRYMLRHKPNGDCHYLSPKGCTIHHMAPWACRQFDCRKWLQGFPEALQDMLLPDDLDGEVVKAARARL